MDDKYVNLNITKLFSYDLFATDTTCLLVFLWLLHKESDGSLYSTRSTIAVNLRMKDSTVYGALRRLEDKGVINIETSGGRGGSTFHIVNSEQYGA